MNVTSQEMEKLRQSRSNMWFDLIRICTHPKQWRTYRGDVSHCNYCENTLRTELMEKEHEERSKKMMDDEFDETEYEASKNVYL